MADMKAATYQKELHPGGRCHCEYCSEVRRRKNPPSAEQIAAALAAAQAGIDRLTAEETARQQHALDAIKPAGEIDHFVATTWKPKGFEPVDHEEQRLENQRKAFEKESKLGHYGGRK